MSGSEYKEPYVKLGNCFLEGKLCSRKVSVGIKYNLDLKVREQPESNTEQV